MAHVIISARRAYEFRADELILTLLTSQGVVSHLRDFFGCSLAQVATPMGIFGEVPQTFPPGAVFDYGAIAVDDETSVPMRFLHIEPRRIVFDVAGESRFIDQGFESLTHTLGTLTMPDGRPAIGEPIRVREFSEIRWDVDAADLSRILAPGLFDIFGEFLLKGRKDDERELVPTFQMRLPYRDREYPGTHLTDLDSFYLDLRAGTIVIEHTLFSGAPLPTDQHLKLIERLTSYVQP